MSFKSPILPVFLSIVFGAFVFSLFLFLSPGGIGVASLTPSYYDTPLHGAACVILNVDESQDDGQIREMLFSAGLGDFISESSQFVPIDDFGSLKLVPLGSFNSEIEAFDPRDSGYAGKLKSFFVHDGMRFFYRLLEAKPGLNAGKMKKQLDSALGNIPFAFTVLGQKQSVLIYFLLLFAASSLTLFFSPSRQLFIFQFPLLLAIGHLGFFSLILAAVLTGIWELLREPLGELSATKRYKRRFLDYAGTGFRGLKERLKPFRFNLLLCLIFMFFLPLFVLFGLLPPVLLAVVCFSFLFLYYLSLKTEEARSLKTRHVPFTPVLMFPAKVRTFSFFPQFLPIGLISLLALFLPQVSMPSLRGLGPLDGYIVSPMDYYRHIAFQRSFSYRPIEYKPMDAGPSSTEALNQMDYFRYHLGEDGLIAGSDPLPAYRFPPEPTFPLEKLMDFLVKYNKPREAKPVGLNQPFDAPLAAKFKEWVSVLMIFSVCLLDFLRHGIRPKKKSPVFGDKRMAA